MTGKEFLNAVCNNREDALQGIFKALVAAGANYCVIGGLAVSAYAEPVVSLDVDIVVSEREAELVCESVKDNFNIERFAHRVNLSTCKSDMRIKLWTDQRYQDFISRAETRTVFGYTMKVARIEDVLQGKIWAYADEGRRTSKRQKDLADIARLIEARHSLVDKVPEEIRKRIV